MDFGCKKEEQNLPETMYLFFGIWGRWKIVREGLIKGRGQMWGERFWKSAFGLVKQQKNVRGGADSGQDHTSMLKSATWTLLGSESLQDL